MLAPEEEPTFALNSSGGRNPCRRKLLAGEQTEVRSVEEGFLGSWFLGTVIDSKKRNRRTIRYDHILSDDATDFLVETVDVSDVIEGLSSGFPDVSDTLRGRLRPVPPKLEVDKLNLPYGLCVDVFSSEAWWEGVIFDHENGSEERRVFFPETGDEMNASLQSVRITQDWNEGAETWECRGRWLFLDLIEKYKEDNYLPVSVKQLWYDIRGRIGFARIQDWTCSTRQLWEDLMLEVIDDNLRITINQLLHDYDAERYPHQELEFVKEDSQAVIQTNACSSGVLEHQFSCIDKDQKLPSQTCQSLSEFTSFSGIRPEESYINEVTEFSSKKSTAKREKVLLPKKPGTWQPFDCVAESCPQAVPSFIRKSSQSVAMHVRKHLKYMGWTIEHIVDESGKPRFRYLSPDRRLTELSLRKVCLLLNQGDEFFTPPAMAKTPLATPTIPPATSNILSLPCENRENLTYNIHEMRTLVLALPASKRNVALDDRRKLSAETLLEGETQEEEGFFKRESHILHPKSAIQTHKKTLCVRLDPKTKAQGFIRLKSKRQHKPNLRYLSKKNEVNVGLRNVNPRMRRGKTSRMLIGIKNRVIGSGKTRVSQSNKRVQRKKSPISRYQSPRSVLSWLIDNNVILPRENIRCHNQKDHTVRKEGKLTREGIKCSCCRRIFTISGFQIHADGESCRAAANIFLDDGRSLLECQVKAYRTRKKAQPPDILKMKLRHGENDIICSVCLYGGKLILCDGCPSAFHANCLGLEDVPDGDWFCASCCCGACGKSSLKDTSQYAKEEELIICKQCELKYHPSCLRYDAAGDSLDTIFGEKWFCSKDCEELFLNLSKLVGKPREVGIEKDLTWRLVQSLEPDTLETEASKLEAVAENHCKLSVALEVMHELFKPVKRPHGGGELAENVIFSRRSKYKRLNFSGFYTVLLERNDELVTVATVRIFGKKVAEMPFIGTRFQHRQLGMCRVLMNELEKVLIDLGVERLVLPAVPCVLNTWTNSFGFTKMTLLEKRDFLKFTFLEFGRTILCQKILIKSNKADPVLSIVSLGEPKCDIIRIEEASASENRSEVHQHLEEPRATKDPPQGIKAEEERLLKKKRILKFYTRRKKKCLRLT